jgi:hypothetical protein
VPCCHRLLPDQGAKADAAEADKKLEAQQTKSVSELRVEVYMDRIQVLNEKEVKEKLTASEIQERDLKLKLVEELRKEQAKK